jgi:hypothetical protein
MGAVHRNGDQRGCGASTVVGGQSSVYVNGKLASVNGDSNSHGGGALSAANPNVYINNKLVVIQSNSAAPDALCPTLAGPHCNPYAVGRSDNVYIGG